jgi:SAM-dependent methyltransferase
LRLLGVISTIRTNTAFLSSRFRQCARTGQFPRVLVSATADYSMLAHLRSAYEGSALEATVVDRCGTSVLLNRWYADRYGLALTAVCDDLLAYAESRPFDLVCTHNLLGRFDPDSRRRLIGRWNALLRPGGLVVTTQRVRPRSEAAFSTYTNEEIQALLDRVAAAVSARPAPLAVATDELLAAVYEYAIRRRAHTVRTTREITDVFESEGFDVELVDEGDAVERARDRPLAAVDRNTYRMRLVARKR